MSTPQRSTANISDCDEIREVILNFDAIDIAIMEPGYRYTE